MHWTAADVDALKQLLDQFSIDVLAISRRVEARTG
jgi:hypothetical protein